MNIILLLDINPLSTSILYKTFVFIIPPTISSRTYSEAGNKAYKANRGTNNKANNKAYKASRGTDNRASSKASKATRAIKANRGITIINFGLSYIAAFYTISATALIIIFINVSSARGSGFSLTG